VSKPSSIARSRGARPRGRFVRGGKCYTPTPSTMRAALSLLTLSLLTTPLSRACSHFPHHHARRGGPAAGAESIRLALPQRGTEALELDAHIGWFYLPEDSVPTASAPRVLVGARLPCGYEPSFGTIDNTGRALRVLLHARYRGTGRPDPSAQCPERTPFVDFISLSQVRLGTYPIVDVADPVGGPHATLHVVEDNAQTPTPAARAVRACTAGDDATCTAGGVCGTLATDAATHSVCVPPLDAYLLVGRPCPAGRREVALDHAGAFAAQPAPAPGPGALRACLPSCDETHPCDPALECVPGSAGGVCVPR